MPVALRPRSAWSALVFGCALLAALAASVPADAATRGVSVGDFFFQPSTTVLTQGDVVTWRNVSSNGIFHTSTSDAGSPVPLWDSGDVLDPGATFTQGFSAAGVYPYHCNVDPQNMRGTVKVALRVSPTNGRVGTTFTVTLASTLAPPGFEYVVMRAGPTSEVSTTTERSITFVASAPGVYSFRSRLNEPLPAESTDLPRSSEFSDAVRVTVR